MLLFVAVMGSLGIYLVARIPTIRIEPGQTLAPAGA
jgi:hypothetical protein